jgi:hypothetical protein
MCHNNTTGTPSPSTGSSNFTHSYQWNQPCNPTCCKQCNAPCCPARKCAYQPCWSQPYYMVYGNGSITITNGTHNEKVE